MIFIDLETYYDQNYNLKKLPTMQYIRDPRFQLIGAAVWMPGWKEIRWWDETKCRKNLPSMPWDKGAVAHNAMFDGAVLAHHLGITPAKWHDTMLMARYLIAQGILPPDQGTSLDAVGAPLGLNKLDMEEDMEAYAKQDVRIMLNAYKLFRPQIPEIELDIMDTRIKAATNPVLSLDTALLQEVANRELHPTAKQLRTQSKFVEALQKLGVEPEYKTSERTGKQTLATAKTDAFMQKLSKHPDPKVRLLHKLKTESNSNINQTRAQRFLDIGAPFPLPLLYYAAHTGRDGGQDKINPQNLPRGGELRRSIRAPEGCKLVIVDSSQIEVRVLAWLAKCKKLISIFEEDKDPYVQFAADILYRKDPGAITKEERRIAKPPVLACGYGQSVNGLIQYAEGMGVQLDQKTAERAVNGYRKKYHEIPAYWGTLMAQVEKRGELILPTGRKLIYPDRFWEGRTLMYKRPQIFSKQYVGQRDKAKIWPGLLAENITQAVARDVVFEQTMQLKERGWSIVLSIHDEVILCVREEDAGRALEDALQAFRTRPKWAPDLPVDGEGDIYTTYGKTKE